MKTFVDTSALYSLLDADDNNHRVAAAWFSESGLIATELVTHNYVLVETAALVHHRLGASGVRDLTDGLVPALSVEYVDEALHARAIAAYMAGLTRRVSFVDRVSFQLMRDAALEQAFAFDRDFRHEGFALVP
jgi:predicted nucleic acid-binding protein